jgi:membrane associated rhomboid family serine protease
MRRSSSPYVSSFSFGPGPLSTTLKALIGANVVMFVAQAVFPVLTEVFGLHPAWVIPALSTRAAEHAFWLWQPATYMFLHGGVFHILFNMLALWMFGAELERIWGTRYFLKFYFVTGIGAGVVTVILSLLPFGGQLQYVNIIGASGAIYGLLLAFAMYFPDRPILLVVFPVPCLSMAIVSSGSMCPAVFSLHD